MIEWVEVDKKQLQYEVHSRNIFCETLGKIKSHIPKDHIEAVPHGEALARLEAISEILNQDELKKLMEN